MVLIFLKTISGLEDIKVSAANDISTTKLNSELKSLLPQNVASKSIIAIANGSSVLRYDTLQQILDISGEGTYLDLHLRIPICGGKGGLTSLKKKQEKKSKATNKDNYRTLDGLRVKDLKKIEKLEKVSMSSNEQERKLLNEKKEKLMKILDADIEAVAKKDAKYDDHQHLEEMEKARNEIRESVSNAMDNSDDSQPKSESKWETDFSSSKLSGPGTEDAGLSSKVAEKCTKDRMSRLDCFFDSDEE
ncbi:hypothetical protein CANARDRAFT_22854 [[Candida] arabinofermentans NRRL YB-2248]|uniref:SDE2-like domain-containing protein n=1 Tax=[Candida] arabinofermentans NRRL YB-2248 TaxID=983967 RepID=A0A1E4T2V1_9ASCO|nr:hypothetical protein CANARDRAFT_22854 [[Candida] arabinofermentans NRRL YB-2248]